MKKQTAVFGVLLLAVTWCSLEAVTPRKWQIDRFEQFLQGKFDRISLSGDGVLSLAPKEEPLPTPTEEFLLSLLFGADGTIFIGTGHAGNIYRIDRAGKIELYFHVPEMDVLCLERDVHGVLYAGTAPNGRIYRITEQGKGAEYFNPKKKYVWDLMFTDKGSLLAAVGESGGIYEITGEGQGVMILEAKENHILCMMQTPGGELMAGSGGQGRLYRIEPGKKPDVLFESPFEEIKSIALGPDGTVFAAAGGSVLRPTAESALIGTGGGASSVPVGGDVTVTVSAVEPQSETSGVSSGGGTQPSALYRIEPSGVARRIWESSEELIYTVLWDREGSRLLFGTGGKGRIYSIDSQEKIALLLQKDSEQIYHLAKNNSRFYFLANNPAVFSAFDPALSYDGEYDSRVFDTGLLSVWGRVEWTADLPRDTIIQVQTRSGNSGQPDQTWSDWSPPYQKSGGEPILSPRGRYLQFKVRFKTESGRLSPTMNRISLFFQQVNVAPRITLLELLPVNTVFLEPPVTEERVWGHQPGSLEQARAVEENRSAAMAKRAERKGFQSLVWNGADENQDHLVYRLSIRKSDEDLWRLLADGLSENIFAFESIAFPDGDYFIQVEASDAPSNPAGAELSAEKVSRPFVIDNSLPEVRNFRAVRSGSVLRLSFTAADTFSRIREVRVLVRPDQWRSILPGDGICDSRLETFELSLPLPAVFDNMVTVCVEDEHGNIGVQRAVF